MRPSPPGNLRRLPRSCVSAAVPSKITPQDLAQEIGYSAEELDRAARRREHGAFLRQSRRARRAETRRSRARPRQRRRLRRVHRRTQGRRHRPRHRRGHDAGNAGQGAPQYRAVTARQTGLDNVEFRLGEIEHLPVADNSVDAIISNCVINLSPDKPQVWREMARVLKPGGRVAVSDMALLKPLPPAVLEMVEALIGCVAGAVLVEETERMAREAGLTDIVLTTKPDYRRGHGGLERPALPENRRTSAGGNRSRRITSPAWKSRRANRKRDE